MPATAGGGGRRFDLRWNARCGSGASPHLPARSLRFGTHSASVAHRHARRDRGNRLQVSMGTAEAMRRDTGFATEFRELLGDALSDLDADEESGPLLRAAALRMRFEFPDLSMVLNVASNEEPGHHLRWEFSDAVDWKPKLNLRMDSRIANAYLQGSESLAIAIAH